MEAVHPTTHLRHVFLFDGRERVRARLGLARVQEPALHAQFFDQRNKAEAARHHADAADQRSGIRMYAADVPCGKEPEPSAGRHV